MHLYHPTIFCKAKGLGSAYLTIVSAWIAPSRNTTPRPLLQRGPSALDYQRFCHSISDVLDTSISCPQQRGYRRITCLDELKPVMARLKLSSAMWFSAGRVPHPLTSADRVTRCGKML